MRDSLTKRPDLSNNPRDQKQGDAEFRGSSIESRYKAIILFLSSLVLTLIIFGGLMVLQYNRTVSLYSGISDIQSRNDLPPAFPTPTESPAIKMEGASQLDSAGGYFSIRNLPEGVTVETRPETDKFPYPCASGKQEWHSIRGREQHFEEYPDGYSPGFHLFVSQLSGHCTGDNYTSLDFIRDYLRDYGRKCPDCLVRFSDERIEVIIRKDISRVGGQNIALTLVGFSGEASNEIVGAGVFRDQVLYIITSAYELEYLNDPNTLFIEEVLKGFQASL